MAWMRIQGWREALESKGFEISHTKIKSIDYNFNEDVWCTKTPLRIGAQGILFWYFGLIISRYGEIERRCQT